MPLLRNKIMFVSWHSGSVLALRRRGRGFEPERLQPSFICFLIFSMSSMDYFLLFVLQIIRIVN